MGFSAPKDKFLMFFFCLIPYLHKISLALDGSFFLYHADNVSSNLFIRMSCFAI